MLFQIWLRHLSPFAVPLVLSGALAAAAQAHPPGYGHAMALRPPSVLGRSAWPDALGPYLAGRFALAEGDADQATDDLELARARDPANFDTVQQGFVASLLAGRPDAVRLARLLPNDEAAQMLLANADIKAGRWNAAETRFRSLLHPAPVQADPGPEGQGQQGQGQDGQAGQGEGGPSPTQFLQPLLIAWARLGEGHADAALDLLHPYLQGPSAQALYVLNAAMIADLGPRGYQLEAARLYQELLTARSDASALRLAQIIASWQARGGHRDDAEKTLRALSDGADEVSIAMPNLIAHMADPPVATPAEGIADAYFALATLLRDDQGGEFSALLLRLALDLRPDFTTARLLLAELQEQAKRYPAALALLAPVADTDPLIGIVRLRRASLREANGDSDGAITDLQHIAQDYPTSPLPYARQGDVLRNKDRYTDAIAAYDKAIALQGSEPVRGAWPLFYARGIAHQQANQWPAAEADLQHALELAPDQPYVLNFLGYSWADQGVQLPRARQMIERAVSLRPSDASIIDSLGWVTLRQGDIPSAVATLERAAEMETEDSTINGHLGDAYWAAGRKLEARYQWERSLSLKPEPEDLPRIEANLRKSDDQAPAAADAAPKSDPQIQ